MFDYSTVLSHSLAKIKVDFARTEVSATGAGGKETQANQLKVNCFGHVASIAHQYELVIPA